VAVLYVLEELLLLFFNLLCCFCLIVVLLEGDKPFFEFWDFETDDIGHGDENGAFFLFFLLLLLYFILDTFFLLILDALAKQFTLLCASSGLYRGGKVKVDPKIPSIPKATDSGAGKLVNSVDFLPICC